MKPLQIGLLTFFISLFSCSTAIQIFAAPQLVSPLADNFEYIEPTPVPASPEPTPSPTSTPTPKPTPTPSPSPTPKPKPTTDQLEEWFTKYANEQSINKDLLKKIAWCESKYNPNATNGIYGGMYQFSPSTWKNTRQQMNKESNPDLRFDPEAAIHAAAFRIATVGDKAWPNCR